MANFLLLCLVPGLLIFAPQQPVTRNAQVETRRVAAGLDGEIAAIAASTTEPVWIGWREAATASGGNQCGVVLEGNDGLVPMATADDVVVMLRVADHTVERVRAFAADCPVDAGGRHVYWLDSVPASESVKYLRSLITLTGAKETATDLRRRLNSGAVSAIGQHRDGSVDTLIELARQSQDTATRNNAVNALGRSKDPKAQAFIDGILKR